MIRMIKNTSDELYEDVTEPDVHGDVDGLPLAVLLRASTTIREGVEKIDYIRGQLGIRSRKDAIKLVALFRENSGIDLEWGNLPELETY